MKISKQTLRKIIKEEVARTLNEGYANYEEYYAAKPYMLKSHIEKCAKGTSDGDGKQAIENFPKEIKSITVQQKGSNYTVKISPVKRDKYQTLTWNVRELDDAKDLSSLLRSNDDNYRVSQETEVSDINLEDPARTGVFKKELEGLISQQKGSYQDSLQRWAKYFPICAMMLKMGKVKY